MHYLGEDFLLAPPNDGCLHRVYLESVVGQPLGEALQHDFELVFVIAHDCAVVRVEGPLVLDCCFNLRGSDR